MAPAITVVVPTRDRWSMLRSALWSVLGQEGVQVHVVVVDDGSTDRTTELLARVDRQGLTVLRHPEPRGVSPARNSGLERVSTEWVAFLDDDDAWAPFHLARAFEAIAKANDDRIDVAYSASLTVTADRTVHELREPAPPDEVAAMLHSENVLGTPSRVVLRTEAVRAAGGFDPDLSVTADWDLWLRVVRTGNAAAAPVPSVAYMEHGANMGLAADRLLEELPLLEERYGSRRPAGRAPFMDACSRWIAGCYRTAGDRRRAASWYLRTFRRERETGDFARAIGMLFGERAIDLTRRVRRGNTAPPTPPWLEEIRRIDRLPPEAVPFGDRA